MACFRMADLITPDRIIPTLSAANKRQVVAKLSRLVAARIGLNEVLLRRTILAQEDSTVFGVGRGIAVPHARVDGIAEPLGAFARLKQPIDFGALDGQPADLVFLLLAPETGSDTLLPALACVARSLRDREVVARLRAESSSEAAHVILTTDSWRGSDPRPDWKHAALA